MQIAKPRGWCCCALALRISEDERRRRDNALCAAGSVRGHKSGGSRFRHGWSARDRNTGYLHGGNSMLRYSFCATLLFAAGTAMAQSDSVQYHYAAAGQAVATDVSATSAGTATASDCSATTGGCASCNDCSCVSSCDCGCKSCCENFCKDCCCDCRPTWTVKAGALIMQ